MNTIEYKLNTGEVFKRLCLLYEQRVQDRIFAVFDVPTQALNNFLRENPLGSCSSPDPVKRIAFWDALWAERRYLEDDSIPSDLLTEFDQGLYGSLVGGDVRFICFENGRIGSIILF